MKINGPLLARIDSHIEMPRLSSEELMGKRVGESKTEMHHVAKVINYRGFDWKLLG